MLIPGLFKLFSQGPSGVGEFLSGLGFPIPLLFAWILIASEIIFGLAILARYELRYTAIPPAIIMIVAAFTVALPASNWPTFLMHIAVATNFWLLSSMAEKD
jgi:uncharacterized membrane protein YphA (DoxX/SURF4 family)